MNRKFILKLRWFVTIVFLFCTIIGHAEYSVRPRFLAIIFDCDGVLVDTEHLKFRAWKEALKKHHIPFRLEDYLPLVGYDSQTIIKMFSVTKNLALSRKVSQEVIVQQKAIYKGLQQKEIIPILSAVSLAKKLSQDKDRLHIKLALASSAPKIEIMKNLRSIGLSKAFDSIISGQDDLQDVVDLEGTNKPKPYIYQKVAKWLQVDPKDCLVFEDTAAGVTAAQSAGMTVFAVPNALTQRQDFSKSARVLTSLSEFDVQNNLYPMSGKKFNLALVPLAKDQVHYVDSAQMNFKAMAQGYLLGSGSLPHISLCQFEIEKESPILAEIQTEMKHWEPSLLKKPVYPEFQSFNIVALTGPFQGQFATDLGVARNEDILLLHRSCLSLLQKFGLKPANAVGELYRPHLTFAFFKSQNALSIPKMPNLLFGRSQGPFYVELGQADENWQYVQSLSMD